MSVVLRFLLLAIVIAGLMDARADAGAEFCSGYVSQVVPIHASAQSKGLGSDSEFGYQIRGPVATTISGTLDVYAGGDLYSIAFNNVQLNARKKQLLDLSSATVLMNFSEAESDPLYFRLPSAARVDAVWIAMAGKPATVVDCPTIPLTAPRPSNIGGNVPDHEIRQKAPADAPVAPMIAHVDTRGCTSLFRDTSAVRLVTPEYPLGASKSSASAVIVRVLIDKDGKVFDASIFGSSGDRYTDEAALSSARGSKYAPATFLCIPIPGIFIFRANFDPH